MNLRRKAKGVTLVELLIVGIMTGILSTALGLILANFSRRAVNNVSVSDVQGDIQGAVSYLNTDLKMARYIYRPNDIGCKALGTLQYCPARLQQTAGSNASIEDNGGSGNSGDSIAIAPLTNSANAKIELAFWMRATKSTSPACAASANSQQFVNLQQGEALSVPNANLSNTAISESDTAICNLVSYGVINAVPAYKFVVYYTTTPTSSFMGPRVLYRWESGVVPIPYADFGYISSSDISKIPAKTASNNITRNAAATNVWVLNPPTLGGGDVISDYLANTTPVKIANSPTNPQSVTVSIQGSMDNVQGNVDTQTKTSNLSKLLFSGTTYARNICSPGAVCPKDPGDSG
ncbi:MAG: prepilin-type N-terminal cleavage/methylation domain-containing protein [Gloeobacterales cyanobacterium]